MINGKKLAVVIPCYKVRDELGAVLDAIDDTIDRVYCVDDFCPDKSYEVAEQRARVDQRIKVIRRSTNGGVGAAMIDGYRMAIDEDIDITVKLDGDGQMDPTDIEKLIRPLVKGTADYSKGNRFFFLESLEEMPRIRIFGNSALAFLSKISSGYWNIFDFTNGFTAIHKKALLHLPLSKISKGYFFESDMLFRLNTIRAVVEDIPMSSKYRNESSGLNIWTVLLSFPYFHAVSFVKRIFYNYILRDFSIGTIYLILGLLLSLFGTVLGVDVVLAREHGQPATAGQVMLFALPIIIGVQFLVGFFVFDIQKIPNQPLQEKL